MHIPPRPLVLATISLLLSFSLLSSSSSPYKCTQDEDCSLNGNCGSDQICTCYPGWKGDDCGVLDLLPATKNTGYNRTNEDISSWGGKIIQDPFNSSLFHLFAAEFTDNCNLNFWSPYSRVIRATSDNPMGPYTFANEVVGTFAHNPSVIFSKAYGLWLLVHIGCNQTNLPTQCTNVDITCDPGNSLNGESGITLRASKTLDGEFLYLGMILGANKMGTWDCDTTNPSLYPLQNGSMVLAYRGCPYQCGGDELINIAYSDSLAGPYVRLQAPPIFSNFNEDPFIWQDQNGNWHLLLHSLEVNGGFGGPNIGRHAFARDFSGPWTFWNRTLAYNTTVEFTDGTSVDLCRRERPQLYHDSKGVLRYLINGVQENCNNAASFTFIQPIRGPEDY